jgi:hypothetical protein
MPRFSSTLALRVSFLAALVAAMPAPASAQQAERPLKDAIAVDAGATCLDATELIEHVETWLGTATVDAEFTVDVHGSRDQPRVVQFQTLRSGRVIAARRFDPGPERCDHLHAALGLAIAMAIKASLVEEIAGGPPPPKPPEAPNATTIRAAPPPAARSQSAASTTSWAIGADGLAALAALPDPAFGLDVRLERALGSSFSVRLGLLALASFGARFPQGAPGRFDTWLLAPRGDLCAAVEASARLRVRGCMGATVGAIHASGYDLPAAEGAFVRWIAVANGLDGELDLTKNWAVDAGVTLFLPVARNSIVVRDPAGRVLEERDLAAVGGLVDLGAVYRF